MDRKAIGHFNDNLMDRTNKSMGGSSTKDDLSCGDMFQEVSEQDNINMRPRIVSCDIFVKNVTAFCPSPKKYACG